MREALAVFLACILLSGCITTGGNVVSDSRDGTGETRNNLNELADQQAESRVNAEKLAGDGRTLEAQLGELGRILEAGNGDQAEFAAILRQIRGRPANEIIERGKSGEPGDGKSQ